MSLDRVILHEAARQLERTGIPVVLLKYGTKKLAFKNPHAFTRYEIDHWFRRNVFNIGALLGNGLMAVDTDGPKAEAWVEENGLSSPMVNHTSRGRHLLMQTDLADPINTKIPEGDLKFNGHVAVAPSWNEEKQWRYVWENSIVRPSELPLFPGELYQALRRPKPSFNDLEIVNPIVNTGRKEERARRYIARIHSIAGQGGDLALFRAACILVQRFELDEATAFRLLAEWNETNAEPPWEIGRVRYKISEALKLKR